LTLPPNLFVVGTVNVDETTYMFSPKVLDRAFVLELQSVRPSEYIDDTPDEDKVYITGQDAVAILRTTQELHSAGLLRSGTPDSILRKAQELCDLEQPLVDQVLAESTQLLDGAYKLLAPVGYGFGFRPINEFYAYLLVWFVAMRRTRNGEEGLYRDWATALDRAFAQKILPKIHGNRRQLGSSLTALDAFLRGNDADGQPAAKYQLADGAFFGISPEEKLNLGADDPMPQSRRKLMEMNQRLLATGYTSFVQ
jgi:hypothetical protein